MNGPGMKETVARMRELMEKIDRPVRLMEVCGTHTVAIFRHGIRDLLPEGVLLLSGPGCPVCVTAVRDVDTAIAIAKSEGVVLTTFGDMMRVPGSGKSLFNAKAEGGDVRIVYSPLDALTFAEREKGKKVVFFATGFETTSPSVAGTIMEAERRGVENFFIYSVHKTAPPALKALLESGEVRVDGFILPGHVSTVIGTAPYGFLASQHGKPSVVTGFDAQDILSGIRMILEQLAAGAARIEIQYTRVVKPEGNPKAIAVLGECFEPEDAEWRGIGTIPLSGLKVREAFGHRDAAAVLRPEVRTENVRTACACGDVLKGVKIPTDCGLFGKACTPDRPVGPCMVSSEGSCAAYYKYKAIEGMKL
ncbi:MAG: hydrogenase formation protein HypD [Nitrospiraceae bacterium]|nr:hydrogenase formation protein HypD [Nitrospiraceae bacterium]